MNVSTNHIFWKKGYVKMEYVKKKKWNKKGGIGLVFVGWQRGGVGWFYIGKGI